MGATYKLKRKLADGTLEDVILQGVITDLGEQEDNALAEQAILELLKPTSVPAGSHFFYTYHTTCRNDAVMALCSKRADYIFITYISSINGTYKYSQYNIATEELQNNCWRSLGDLNPSFESVTIIESNEDSYYNNHINAQGFYIDHDTTDGSDYLAFNIVDGVELSQSDGTSLVLNGGYFGAGDSDGNSLSITPSVITHNDNEYQFPNKSGTLATLDDIATSGGGVKKLTSATTSININSNVVGAYFKVFGTIEAADELTIGSNSIGLDSGHTYFVSVEGNLFRRVSDTNYWNIMVTLKQHEGIVSYSSYYITSTSGFNISDTGQPPLNSVSYSGILYE